MNEDYIVTAFYVIDEMLKLVAYQNDPIIWNGRCAS